MAVLKQALYVFDYMKVRVLVVWISTQKHVKAEKAQARFS